jgi:hypothetical protein
MMQPAEISIWERLTVWLNQPRHAAGLWLGKWSVVAAWLGLFLAVVTPPHGLGVQLCWFHSATGIPCPGCGMTRSLSCALRGMLVESWQFHPMGFLILALFLVTAVQSVCPRQVREKLRRFIETRALWFNGFYLLFVTTFVVYGTVRALACVGARMTQ